MGGKYAHPGLKGLLFKVLRRGDAMVLMVDLNICEPDPLDDSPREHTFYGVAQELGRIRQRDR